MASASRLLLKWLPRKVDAVSQLHFHSFPVRRRFLATATSANTVFGEYLEAQRCLQEYLESEENEKSQRMFEAWSETQEKNPKSQGVAVVRTLAKETNKQLHHDSTERENLQINAAKLLEKAANDFGHPDALVLWGNNIIENIPEDAASTHAKEQIDKAIEAYRSSKSARGWFNIGMLLWNGFPDQSEQAVELDEIVLLANPDEAMVAFVKARELDDPDALYFCGVWALDSEESALLKRSVQMSSEEGLLCIQRAAELGHGGALHYLALLYLSGREESSIEINLDKFQDFLIRAVEANYAESVFFRGHAYLSGDYGFARDPAAALRDFEKAGVGLGHADASISAGVMYFKGLGAPVDKRRAFELYQNAGELGSEAGWRNVVACYAYGEGVARNENMATYIAKTVLREDNRPRS